MTILFIDNDEEDIALYKEAIDHINASEYFGDSEAKINCLTLTECGNVISYLVNLTAKPDIIFLDINMPRIGGKECLQMLKSCGELSTIPIIMLSTNCPLSDSEEFKRIGALECIQKPNSFNGLVKIFSKFIFQRRTAGLYHSGK